MQRKRIQSISIPAVQANPQSGSEGLAVPVEEQYIAPIVQPIAPQLNKITRIMFLTIGL